MEVEEEEASPVPVTVLIEKDIGALEIQAQIDGESFFIDNVSHFESKTLAADESIEGDWKRRGLYSGPVFEVLDPAVVEGFHKYLEERGFDTALASFVPAYLENKEQLEYQNWLKKVSSFISKD